MGLKAAMLKEADIVEVTGEDKYAHKTAFIVKTRNGAKYWFARYKKLGLFEKVVTGTFNQNGVKQFKSIMGGSVSSAKTNERLEYVGQVRSRKLAAQYRHLSGSFLNEYHGLINTLLNSGDEVSQSFAKNLSQPLLEHAFNGRLKFSDLTSGTFISDQQQGTGRRRFYLFAPSGSGAAAYLFDGATGDLETLWPYKAHDTPEFKSYLRSVNSSERQELLHGAFVLSDKNVAFFRRGTLSVNDVPYDIYRRYSELTRSYVLNISRERLLSQIKRSLIEKDVANEQFEGGPYALISEGLESFIKSGQVNPELFRDLPNLTVVGSGHALDDPKKSFTVFKLMFGKYYMAMTDEGFK